MKMGQTLLGVMRLLSLLLVVLMLLLLLLSLFETLATTEAVVGGGILEEAGDVHGVRRTIVVVVSGKQVFGEFGNLRPGGSFLHVHSTIARSPIAYIHGNHFSRAVIV